MVLTSTDCISQQSTPPVMAASSANLLEPTYASLDIKTETSTNNDNDKHYALSNEANQSTVSVTQLEEVIIETYTIDATANESRTIILTRVERCRLQPSLDDTELLANQGSHNSNHQPIACQPNLAVIKTETTDVNTDNAESESDNRLDGRDSPEMWHLQVQKIKTDLEVGSQGAIASATDSYRCDQCQKSFTRRAKLVFHQKWTHETNASSSDEEQVAHETSTSSSDDDQGTQSVRQKLPNRTRASKNSRNKELVLKVLKIQIEKCDQINHYKCKVCKMMFQEREILVDHHRRYHADDQDVVHQCNRCNKIFASLVDLNVHRLSHAQTVPGKRSYICRACNTIFPNRTRLNAHAVTHAKRKQTATKPSKRKDLKKRAKSKIVPGGKVSPARKIRIPEETNTPCRRSERIPKPTTRITDNPPTNSSDEDGVSNSEDSAANFSKGKSNEDPDCRKGKKTTCEKTSSSDEESSSDDSDANSSKRKSKADDTGRIRTKSYQCHLCPHTFVSACDLKVHLRVHTGEKPFTCSHKGCNKTFSRQGNLNAHLLVHASRTDASTKMHKCTVCLKGFIHMKDLTRHARIHTMEKPYSCSQCQAAFNRRDLLSLHLATHREGRKFECGQCARAFHKKRWLKRHLKSHRVVKPLQCEWCQRAFCKLESLNNHIAHKHTGVMPHVCPACGNGFIRPESLKRHRRKCCTARANAKRK